MKVSLSNFFTNYLLHPLSEQISKRDRAICFVASLILGLCTAGLLHLGMAIYNWSSRKVDDHTHARDDTEDGVDAVASQSFPHSHRRRPSADASDIQEIERKLHSTLENINRLIADQETRREFQELGEQIFNNASQLLAECAEPELRQDIVEYTKSELDILIPTAEQIMNKPYAKDSYNLIKWVQDVTSLINSSGKGNYRPEMGEQLDALLKRNPNVNEDPLIWLNGTALHHLAKNGRPEQFVEIFANNGIDFNRLDSYGNTALVWAIANGQNTIALEILKYEQNLDISCHGNTALLLAVAKGYKDRTSEGERLTVSNLQLVQQLAKKKANPNLLNINGGFSALHLACIRRDKEMLQALIENGGDLSVKSQDGRTCKELLECSFEDANTIIRTITPPYLLPEADFNAGYQECLALIS